MKLSSSRVVNVWDLRRVAQKRIPRVVFDYLDGGAEGEVTLRENCHAFESVVFRPRQAVAFAQIDLHTQVLGTDLSLPFMLAPVGYSRLMHPGGEVVAARGGRGGHRIYPFHDFRSQAGRCEGGHQRAGVVSALPGGR